MKIVENLQQIETLAKITQNAGNVTFLPE